MEPITVLVIFIIAVALIFDYTNGMHDAANSIATVVSTRVLSPGVAVMWAAFFNFIAFAVFGTAVAKMIGGGLVDLNPIPKDLHLFVLLAGLLGVITWNLLTWWLGLPTSSSHALIGGYAGRGHCCLVGIWRNYSGGLVCNARVYTSGAAYGADDGLHADACGLSGYSGRSRYQR